MALIFVDSFDTYQTAHITSKWTSKQGSPTIGSGGRTSNALATQDIQGVHKGVPSQTTYIVGGAFKAASFPGASPFCFMLFSSTNTPEVGIFLTSSGAIAVYRAGQTSIGGQLAYYSDYLDSSDGGIISTGVWYYIEARIYLHSTNGTWSVKVNGVEVVAGTGNTVENEAAIKQVSVGHFGGGTGTSYIDDVYICDTSGTVNNTFLGDVTVEAIYPNADGSSSQFTGSDADQTNNYQLVDEKVGDTTYPDTSDYVASSTATHKDLYNFSAMTPSSATIHGVQVNILAQKSDTGTRTYKSVAKLSSGSATDGDVEFAPSDSAWAYGCDVWETTPGTSNAWTVSDVNGAEFGVKVET